MEKKSTEGYVYIGEHYDSVGRPLDLSDKKIGFTIDPPTRENSWSKTKSPYLYRHIKSYLVDDMFRVEKLLHAILDSRNTNGEWFEDNQNTLVDDFTKFMEIYGGILYEPEVKSVEKSSNNISSFGNIVLIDDGEQKTFKYDYEYITYFVRRIVEKVGIDEVVQENIWICKKMEDFPDVYLNNYKSAIKEVDGYFVCTWGNRRQKFEMMRKSLELVPELCDELVLKME